MGYCDVRLSQNMTFSQKFGVAVASQTTNSKNNVKGRKMRSLGLVAVAALAIAIVFFAVIYTPGNTNIETIQYDFKDFTSVSAGNGFGIHITKGDEYSVNVTTSPNKQERVEISNIDGTLVINIKQGGNTFLPSPLKVEITMPDLENIELADGASATVYDFNLSHNFAAHLTGGSSLTMTGQALNLTINGQGGAIANLSEFPVNNVYVDLNGGSQCTVNTNGKIAGTINGGAKLSYIGNPTLEELEVSGGASLQPAD